VPRVAPGHGGAVGPGHSLAPWPSAGEAGDVSDARR
jgi:hypothetical protein